jgi:mono/diheme cytochrome c family protein
MLVLLSFSSVVIACLLLRAAYVRHRPRRLWRTIVFYSCLTFFSLVFLVSWRGSRASAAEIDPVRAEAGKELFVSSGCSSCHSLGQGLVLGPDLLDVSEKYSRDVLVLWMTNSDEIYRYFGRRPLAAGNPDMPNLGLPEPDARLVAEYLVSLEQHRSR